MTFSPINEDHALETIRFSLSLSEIIDPRSLQEIKNARELWADMLPAENDDIITLNLASRPIDVSGVTFAFLQPNGIPTWQMRIAGFDIEILCTLYTRWEKVWRRVASHLRDILSLVAKHQKKAKVMKAEMTVHDGFYSSNASYDLSQLLKNTDKIPNFIFSVGKAWHTRNGWFEGEPMKLMLHNLDLESIQLGSEHTKVQIKHFMRSDIDVVVTSQKADQDLITEVTEKFIFMHEQNKLTLGQLLTDEYVEKIKLLGST